MEVVSSGDLNQGLLTELQSSKFFCCTVSIPKSDGARKPSRHAPNDLS
jgi:hypothetical protein